MGGDSFGVDASLISADACRFERIEPEEWAPAKITRATQEYLDTLDDAAFGAATPVKPKALSPSDPAARFTAANGDRPFYAYSTNYLVILARDAQPVIPPRKGAAIHPPPGRKDVPPTRGVAVARIAEVGREAWKAETGYHRRSLAETAMLRYKTLIGPSLRSRTFDRQKVEAAVAVRCINRFTALGMPRSIRIA